MKKIRFIFEKVLVFLSLLWYVVVLTGDAIRHKRITKVCYKSYALVPKWIEAIFIQS